jgi:hypothetical protein
LIIQRFLKLFAGISDLIHDPKIKAAPARQHKVNRARPLPRRFPPPWFGS